jgi:putative glycosyltransferase (TIGR04372 family)
MRGRPSIVLRLKVAARKALDLGAEVGVFVVSLVGVPVFLVRNRRLFRNPIVYPVWVWSFGHGVSGLDYAARLFHPNRVSVVFVSHPRANSELPRCFEHTLEPFVLRPRFGNPGGRRGRGRFWLLKLVLQVASAVTGRFRVIELETVYATVSLAAGRRLRGGVDDRLADVTDWTGYMRLLRDDVGLPPSLPADLRERCRERICAVHPTFFEHPFAALLLRDKDPGGLPDTALRSSGPQENYRAAVRLLAESGLHVVGGAETDDRVFADIPGYFPLGKAGLTRDELSVFVSLESVLVVTQQSGTHVLANAAGIPCVLCDAMPHRLGTFRADDLVLFKHLRDRRTGRRLSLVEIFREHPGLAYGYGFESEGVEVEPNEPEEIADAVGETLARMRGELVLDETEKALCDAFGDLPDPSMTLSIQGNHPPLSVLRALSDELLATRPDGYTASRESVG